LYGVIDVAGMPDYTVADTIDAYVSYPESNEIRAVILGTTYTTDAQQIGQNPPQNQEEGDDIPITVSKAVSAMYTATETYANKFRVDEAAYSPSEIVIGYDMPIQFRIVNQGMSKIEKATIRIGGKLNEYKDLSVLPNSSHVLTFYYEVPNPVTDMNYTVEAEFADGEIRTENGTIQLDVPDIGIAKIDITEEKDGKRTLTVPIYNSSDAVLAGKGWTVKLGLYSGNLYTDEKRIGQVIEITDPAELALMDQGGYMKQIEFDLKAYLASQGMTEIPDDGINLYMYAWAENTDGETVFEFNRFNNEGKIWIESLSHSGGIRCHRCNR
jgi:hypothetical protein